MNEQLQQNTLGSSKQKLNEMNREKAKKGHLRKQIFRCCTEIIEMETISVERWRQNMRKFPSCVLTQVLN